MTRCLEDNSAILAACFVRPGDETGDPNPRPSRCSNVTILYTWNSFTRSLCGCYWLILTHLKAVVVQSPRNRFFYSYTSSNLPGSKVRCQTGRPTAGITPVYREKKSIDSSYVWEESHEHWAEPGRCRIAEWKMHRQSKGRVQGEMHPVWVWVWVWALTE